MKNKTIKILCIGDIVGKPGRRAVQELVPALRKEEEIDFVVANAENCAGGAGLTARIAGQMLRSECDVLTLGDHAWDQKEMEDYLDTTDLVLRPGNFSKVAPGHGWCVKDIGGIKIAVVDIMGRVFMKYQIDSPFEWISENFDRIRQEANIIIFDIHAEATSEKMALFHFLNGKVSLIFGTHTHIQTADESVSPKGTAYITDVGMTGPYDSVIGQKKENIIKKYVTGLPVQFEVATQDVWLCGVIAEIDSSTGKAISIKRVKKFFTEEDEK